MNRLGPRSAVAVVVSVVMFVCSTQVRRETLGLIGVCFSKVWLLFYSCGLPLNGSASPFTTKIGGNIQAAQVFVYKKNSKFSAKAYKKIDFWPQNPQKSLCAHI